MFVWFGVGGSPVSRAQQAGTPEPNGYYTINAVTLPNGMVVEEAIINGPSSPPPGFEVERQAVSLPKPDSAAGTNVLTVPAFNWVFGCSAVSGAMIAGYYDRTGFPNMYTGPTNGGVIPLDDSPWPTWSDGSDTYPICPLIASKNGVDGRTTRGSIDDYWTQYDSSAQDPYITGSWAQHTWGSAIGDYMKTSQSAYGNTDGATTFWNWTNSASPLTCAYMVSNALPDGTLGRKLFYEARGYTVADCYNQKTDNTIAGGFSFAQFKTEIDAGRPVMLNLAGHTIVGIGYDSSSNLVYLHDTWDYLNHTMAWGGSYSGMALQSVSIVNIQSSGDVTPPTINFTAYPTLNTWYNTNRRIDWTVSDTSGIWGFSQAWDTSPSGPPPQFPDATTGWLDFAGLGQGQHTIRVRAWDNAAAHNETSAQLGWLGYDTYAPSNPSSTSSGCTAANNVWQNTCAAPNFSWSGASDGNGSGIKDYRYYWGPSASGAPSTYTSAASYDPPPVAGPVAVQYLRIATRDNLNQESLPSTAFVFLYDASAPTATVQINHGGASANQVNVTLNLTSSDTGSGVSEVRLSGNNTDWSAWQPFTAELPWTLPALNRRTATVYVQVRDRAGNLSGTATASIYLDLYPIAPHSASYRLCQNVTNVGGSTRITSTNYLLASAIGQPTASGANSTVGTSYTGQSGFLANLTACLPITYTATTNYTLTQSIIASAGNLRGSTSYRLGDTTGQALASGAAVFSSTTYRMSSGFWAAITTTVPVTTTPPTPVPTRTPTPTPTPGPTATPQPTSFGVTINDGALYTNDPQVTVRASGPNVLQTMLSNDGGFLNAPWQTHQLTYTWVLSTYGNQSMPRLVYVRFQDANNVVYGTYFDDIIYDPVAPQGSVLMLGNSGTSTVTLWLQAQDDYSGIKEMRLSEAPTLSDVAWQPFTNTVDWVLNSNVVYAQYRDQAGNLSPIYTSDGTTYNPSAKKVYLPLIMYNYSPPIPLQANFTASPTSGVAPLTVDFTNTSAGDYTDSLWDFGDGVTSTLPSLTHTYVLTRSYTVTLTITSATETSTLVRTNSITVTDVRPELIVNGGFETDAAWQSNNSHDIGSYSMAQAHNGARSFKLGVLSTEPLQYSYASVTQLITVPVDVPKVTLSFWYWPRYESGSVALATNRQAVRVLNANHSVLREVLASSDDAAGWQFRTFDLTGYAGQAVYLEFSVFNDGDFRHKRAAMYVDDVSLLK